MAAEGSANFFLADSEDFISVLNEFEAPSDSEYDADDPFDADELFHDEEGDEEGMLVRLEENEAERTDGIINSLQHEDEHSADHLALCKCNCKNKCIAQFTKDEVSTARLAMFELEPIPKECAILSAIQGGFHSADTTQKSKKKNQTERKKSRTSYRFLNKDICMATFCYLYTTSPTRLKLIVKQFNEHRSITPRNNSQGKRPGIT